MFDSIQKITRIDNYYEVFTPDGLVIKIDSSEVSNINKIDNIVEDESKAENAISNGAIQDIDESGDSVVEINQVDDGLGDLNWDSIVSKKAEIRIDHVNRHSVEKIES